MPCSSMKQSYMRELDKVRRKCGMENYFGVGFEDKSGGLTMM